MPMAASAGPALRTAATLPIVTRRERRSGRQRHADGEERDDGQTTPASKVREPSSVTTVLPLPSSMPASTAMNVTVDALAAAWVPQLGRERCVVAQDQPDDERHELQDRHGPHELGDVEGNAPADLGQF